MLKDKIRSVNARMHPQRVFLDPKWVVLGVNNVCNLHCKMCDVGTQNYESNFAQNLVGSHPINMPLELIKMVIEQTSEYWPSTKLAYAFTEPLVYPHLVESLAYANEKGLYTTVTTNALTLRQKAAQLVGAGLNHIYVSIDGPQDIHNEIRGNKKSFQKALEGIEALHQFPSAPSVDIITAITEWNIGHLMELLEALKEIPIREVSFMHTQFNDPDMVHKHNKVWGELYPATPSNLDEVNLDNMNLKTLAGEITAIRKKNWPFKVSFAPELDSESALMDYYHTPEKRFVRHCSAIFNSIMIKSDGTLIPAHGRCFNLEVGSLYKQTLPEIWNSMTFSKFRRDAMASGGLFDGCSRCCSAV